MLGRIKLFAILRLIGLWGLLPAAAPVYAASENRCGCLFEYAGQCVPKPCDHEWVLKSTQFDINKEMKGVIFRPGAIEVASDFPAGPISDTGYSELTTLGGEARGYGLYSYVIVTANTPRTVAFMKALFKSIPSAAVFIGNKLRVNIVHVPVIGSKKTEFLALKKSLASKDDAKLAEMYMQFFYDQAMAIDIFNRICKDATGKVRAPCSSDTSEGPFLFTYVRPITTLPKVPPPYLLVDLRRPMHEKAFATILSRYKEQVKGENFADDTRIDTFSSTVLSIVLTAADWTDAISRDISTVVQAVGLGGTKKN